MFASFDETQQRFLTTSKVNPHLTRLATGKRTFRDPILDPVLATFLSKVTKNVTDRDYRVSGVRMGTKRVFEAVMWAERTLKLAVRMKTSPLVRTPGRA